MKIQKRILAIDFVVIVGTLLIIAGIVGYTRPLVLSPIDNFETTETAVLFEFEKANVILLDDNSQLSSPDKIYVENNLIINLKPGVYYWKVEGALESEVRKITIESEIDLILKESDDGFEVANAGNTRFNVDIYGADDKLIGNVILDVGKTKNVENNVTKFIGRDDE